MRLATAATTATTVPTTTDYQIRTKCDIGE